jgi:alpha-galactosidase/6-phospho-beta-glucosidase family protein
MKTLLISLLVLLLGSCSLFESTPRAVIQGQRAVYQSAIVNKQQCDAIIDRYIEDTKRLVTYHANYVFQLKLKEIESSTNQWPPREQKIKRAEDKRDAEIEKAFAGIDKRATRLRQQVKEHSEISMSLIEAVYNYLSVTPIQVDNIGFWVRKLNQIAKRKRG